METKNLTGEYGKIWDLALPLLKRGRLGDDKHALEVVDLIMNYKGKLRLDKDVLIPVAIMHDIGHSAILPEHFKFVTGPEKIANAKLVHMLTGAKIAKEILDSIGYNSEKIKEIIDIISIHDADQLTGIDSDRIYNSENKRIFHDIDSLDRFNKERLDLFKKQFKDRDSGYIKEQLLTSMKMIFYPEFRKIAEERVKKLGIL